MRRQQLAVFLFAFWLPATSLGADTGRDLRLIDAVKRADTGAVRALVKQSVDVNARSGDGSSALHWAVYRSDREAADLLIRAGAAVNASTDLGITPLWMACSNGSTTLIARLLEARADPNIAPPTNGTPLMLASRTGNAEAVKLLLDHDANVNAKEARENSRGFSHQSEGMMTMQACVRIMWLSLAIGLCLSLQPISAGAQKPPLPPSKMRYPLEWAFKVPPPRGTVTPNSACEVAEEYVRQINAKRPATGVAELFAEDGVVLQGGGKLLRGRKEIHGFYDVTDAGRGVIPLSFLDNGAECDMEIAIQRYGPDETWRLAGSRHFTITPDRQIARLIFYAYESAAPPSRGR